MNSRVVKLARFLAFVLPPFMLCTVILAIIPTFIIKESEPLAWLSLFGGYAEKALPRVQAALRGWALSVLVVSEAHNHKWNLFPLVFIALDEQQKSAIHGIMLSIDALAFVVIVVRWIRKRKAQLSSARIQAVRPVAGNIDDGPGSRKL